MYAAQWSFSQLQIKGLLSRLTVHSVIVWTESDRDHPYMFSQSPTPSRQAERNFSKHRDRQAPMTRSLLASCMPTTNPAMVSLQLHVLTNVSIWMCDWTIGLRTLFGLVAAAQLFSWRASPPGFESSTSTGPSSQGHTKGTFAPLNLTLHQDEWGFQWSTLCTWCANSNHGQPPNHAARHQPIHQPDL